MSLPVHLVPSLDGVRPGSPVTVEGDEAHHAVAVRRLRAGERVVLTDGTGSTVVGTVAATGKRRLEVVVDEVTHHDGPDPAVVVVQALPKGDRGELAVEVLTEIGVTEIVPWASSRSVAVWKGERGDKALARWRSTAREATKQSRRLAQPDVRPVLSTTQLAAALADVDVALVLHEDATTALREVALPAEGTVALVVGPEGGIAPEELERFAAAGARAVTVSDAVLRTSTAGVVAVAGLLLR